MEQGQPQSGEHMIHAQIGGKILGQGTYGCIFDPPLACQRDRKLKRGQLGKLTETIDAEEERKAATFIKKIDNWYDYFIIADLKSFCQPKPVKQQPEKDLLYCEVVNKAGFEGMVQFNMPYGGVDLHATMDFKSIEPSKFKIFDFVEHLFEGAALMVLAGFCHFDIHTRNILIDKHMTARFIDYGDSFIANNINIKMMRARDKQYKPSFSTESPEMMVLSGLRHDKSVDDSLMEALSVKEPILLAERFLGLSRRKQAENFRKFWGTSRAVRHEDWVMFWKTYWPMFDSWSIGAVLIEMLNRLVRRTDSAMLGLNSPRMEVLQNALRMMLQISPRERFDCVEVLNMYDPLNKVLKTTAAKKWLEKRKKERNYGG